MLLLLAAVGVDIAVPWRLLFLLSAAILGVVVIRRRARIPARDFPSAQVAQAQTYEERRTAVIEAAVRSRVSDAELKLLSFTLLYPELARKRVVEQIDLSLNPIMKSASMDLNLPDALIPKKKSALAYVPIVRPVKSRHIPHLKVTDEHGGQVLVLNHEETVAVLVKLADALLRRACRVTPNTPLSVEQGQVLAHFVECLLSVPQQNILSTANRTKVRDQAVIRLDQLRRHLHVYDDTKWRELKRLLSLVSCNYVVLGRTKPADRIFINYCYEVRRLFNPERRNRILQQKDTRWTDSMRGFLRRASLTEAARVRVSVNKGNSCDSYHMSVSVPEGAHVATIKLMDASGRPIKKPGPPPYDLSQGYFRVDGKSTPNAHLYARGLIRCHTPAPPARQRGPAFLELSVYETPPGAMGRAAFASVLVTLLIYLVGVRVEQNLSLNIDTLALIGGTAVV